MMLLVYAALSYQSKRSASQRNSLSSERQASIKYSCSKACQQLVKHVSKRVAAELSEQRDRHQSSIPVVKHVSS